MKTLTKEDVIEIYNAGYSQGHHDTVESQYTDIHREDAREYHSDVVEDILKDMDVETE